MAKNAENSHEQSDREREKREINGKSQPTINRAQKLKYSKFVRNQGIRMCHVICALFLLVHSHKACTAYTLTHTHALCTIWPFANFQMFVIHAVVIRSVTVNL